MKDLNKLRELQKDLAKKVIIRDEFKLNNVKTIAGFDLAYQGKKVVCAGVVLNYKTMELIEKKCTITDEQMPYIPTYLMFREGPPIIEMCHDLENKPDIIMIDGSGILHPYRCGVATYVGISLDIPTIGVIKKLLCGEVLEGKVYVDKEVRGVRVETKKGSRPVFVSPGHKVSVGTAMKIVNHCLRGNHKLPEPLRLAHRFADKAREKLLLKKEE